MLPTNNNFLDIPEDWTHPDTACYAILPLPYERTVSYGTGTADGPAAIINASAQVEWYDQETGHEACQAGIYTAPAPELPDAIPDAIAAIERATAALMQDKRVVIALGGEHSIVAGTLPPHARRFPSLSVLHVDAHADLRDEYQGTPYSHASAAARMLEHCPIVQVGVRSYSHAEADRMRASNRIQTLHAHECTGGWIDRVVSALSEYVYVSFDVDGLDPSECPATGTPEPGGLSWTQVTTLLKRVCSEKKIVGADFTELAPRPPEYRSDFLVARLVYKFISYHDAFSR